MWNFPDFLLSLLIIPNTRATVNTKSGEKGLLMGFYSVEFTKIPLYVS